MNRGGALEDLEVLEAEAGRFLLRSRTPDEARAPGPLGLYSGGVPLKHIWSWPADSTAPNRRW